MLAVENQNTVLILGRRIVQRTESLPASGRQLPSLRYTGHSRPNPNLV